MSWRLGMGSKAASRSMGQLMAKKIDISKVESALKPAAEVAVRGRRDERAGRFMRQKDKSKSATSSDKTLRNQK
jgi:hypothetical protein